MKDIEVVVKIDMPTYQTMVSLVMAAHFEGKEIEGFKISYGKTLEYLGEEVDNDFIEPIYKDVRQVDEEKEL